MDSIESMDVSHARTGIGLGAGILAGAGLGAAWTRSRGSARERMWAGAVIALPGAVAGASCARSGGSVATGALAGAGTGLAIWGGLALLLSSGDDPWLTDEQTAGIAALGAGVGALSGGIAAAVGREKWQAVPGQRLRMSVTPARGGGFAAAMQISF